MKKYLLVILIVITALISAVAQETRDFLFTEEEQLWLDEHPTIRVGIMNSWPPMDFVDSTGSPQGIGVEYIHALNNYLDGRLQIVPGPFNKLYDLVKERKLDALMDITPRENREPYFHFSTPYIIVPHVIIGRSNEPLYKNEFDLVNKSIAIEKGFFLKDYFNEKYPSITVHEFPTTAAALEAVSMGQVDVYTGNRAVASYLIEKRLLTNIKIHGRLHITGSINSMGIRKDWPLFESIVNKALAAMPLEEVLAIHRKWIGGVSLSDNQFRLTYEEARWIQEKGSLKIGINEAWPPMNFVDSTGVAKGVGVDYIREINKLIDNALVVVPGSLEDNYKKLASGELDAVMDMYPQGDFDSVRYTKAYMQVPQVLVGRTNETYYQSESDLAGKVVAVEKVSPYFEFFENLDDISFMEFEDTRACLDALSRSVVDAYVGNRMVVQFLIKDGLFNNLEIQGRIDRGAPEDVVFGVRSENSLLIEVLNRAIRALENESDHILWRWTGRYNGDFFLTDNERDWLEGQKKLVLGIDPSWPPFDFVDNNGKHRGISSDYIKLLEERIGIPIILNTITSWDEMLNRAKEGHIDIIPSIVFTAERDRYLDFTSPFLSVPLVVVTHEDAPLITGLESLDGRSIAVVKGVAGEKYLQRDYPSLDIKTFNSMEEVLRSVSRHESFAMLGNIALIDYYKRVLDIDNLKVAATTPYSYNLSFGVKEGAWELKNIIDRFLLSLSEKEKSLIYDKWVNIPVSRQIDWDYIRNMILLIVFVAAVIIAVVLIWNHKLAGEIKERKRVEEVIRKSAEMNKILMELGLLQDASEEDILNQALERMVALSESSIGYLHFINEKQNSISLFSWSKKVHETCDIVEKRHYPLEKAGIWADCIRLKKPVIHNNYPEMGRNVRLPEGHVPLLRHLSVPVFFGGEMVAVIGVGNKAQPYDSNDSNMLSFFSGKLWDILLMFKTKSALQLSENRLNEAQRIAHVGSFDYNLSSKSAYWSKEFYHILGYLPGDIMPSRRNFIKHVLKNDKNRVMRLLRRALHEKQAFETECRIQRNNGSLVWVFIHGDIQKSEYGKAISYKGTLLDITSRKNAEIQVAQSRDRFRALIESTRDWVWEMNKSCRFTYVSPQIQDILGYKVNEMLGKTPFDLMSQEEARRTESLFLRIREKKEPIINLEYQCIHKKGHTVVLQTNGSPILDHNGELVGYRGIDRDITERKSFDRLKEDVDKIMRHDLKAPLNCIIGFPQLLQFDENLTDKQKRFLGLIEESGKQMMNMINMSLDLYKMETRSYDYHPTRTDLISLIKKTLLVLTNSINAKNLSHIITINDVPIEKNATFYVYAEETLCYRMILNLIKNAHEAAPRGSSVGIYLTSTHTGMLVVHNQGVVPGAIRDTFFDKYATYGKTGGTGLGTYSAKLTALTQGGTIDMSSSEKDGTRIYVTIPFPPG